MNRILMGAALAGLLAAPAHAEPAASGQPQSQARSRSPVCLDTMRIQNTRTPDDRTILFYMNDGKIWKNTLKNKCVGLTFNGFSYEPMPPHQICDNMQTIRVIRDGTVCMMGAFEPYTPPPKEKPKQ